MTVAEATLGPRTDRENGAGLLYLTDPLRFPFRGRLYEVPPLPFKDGLELTEIAHGFERIARAAGGDESLAGELTRTVERLQRELPRLVRPVRGPRRWLWRLRLRRNPFLQASLGELRDLLAILSRARMASSVHKLPDDPLSVPRKGFH